MLSRDEVIELLILGRRAQYAVDRAVTQEDPCGYALLSYLDGDISGIGFSADDAVVYLSLAKRLLRSGNVADAKRWLATARIEAFVGAVLSAAK
jgi:hypothetical protein